MELLPDEQRTRILPSGHLQAVLRQQELESREIYWSILNSPLEKSAPSFNYSFASTLPTPEDGSQPSIKAYIEGTLASKSGDVLAIELGGLGSALFAGFTPGFIKESRAISLVDNRHFFEDIDPLADSARNHEVIAGDLVSHEVKQQVRQWLGGRKLDLIMERMRGGLAFLPEDHRTLLADLNFWYQHLSVGGVLFAEVPPALEPYATTWAEYAQTHGLDISMGAMRHYDPDTTAKVSVIRMLKTEQSPEAFPFV